MSHIDSIAGLARVLTKTHGIEVTVSGDGSYISGNNINIARMPDTPLGRMLSTGLVTHEIGHKNHTQGDKPPGMHGTLTNVIEDIRTELKTIEERPGARFNLDEVTTHYVDQGSLDPKDLMSAIITKIMAYGRSRMLNQPAMLKVEPMADEIMDDAFGESFIKGVETLANKMNLLENTIDSQKLAKEVVDLILQAEEEKKQNSPQGKQGVQGAGKPEKGQGKGKAGGNNETGSGGPQNAQEKTIQEMLAEESNFGDLSELIKNEMNKQAAKATNQQDIPIEPFIGRVSKASKKLNEVEAISASSKMRAKMMGHLQSVKRQPITFGSSGKKLVTNRLYKIGLDDIKIFKRKAETQSVNTAIVIAIDASGSMEGSEYLTNPCAYAIHHALYGIKGASVCSVLFQGSGGSKKHPNVKIVTGFTEKPMSENFNIDPDGGTPTPTCIWAARNMLLERKEKRKILLLITDGDPNSVSQTNAATKSAEKAGIEVAAIGINTECVKKLWKASKCIKTIQELPPAMFEVMESILTTR